MSETPLPILVKLRTEQELPIARKSSTLKLPPHLANDRSDRLLPRDTKLTMDALSPPRTKPRMLVAEPILA
jgi:hypothetical protein